INHVQRQAARRKLEAAADFGPTKAQALDRRARLLVQIGESHPKAPGLPVGRARGRGDGEDRQQEMPALHSKRRHNVALSEMPCRHTYRMASILTKVPVVPTAFGTVIERKKVARLLLAASAAIKSVRTFSTMWMPLSVSNSAWTGKASMV